MKTVLDHIIEHKLVAILRGVPPTKMKAIANALYDGGVRLLEITLNSENALPLIEMLHHEFKERLLIGAGTVLDKSDARNAIAAGAQFIISPMLDKDVIKITKEAGGISIPGAFTPTEIWQAHNSGADIVKIFPCPDAAYVKNILAPLDQVRVMPTGGIDASNIKTFAATGAVAFGIGSSLVNSKSVNKEDYLPAITANAQALFAALNS